MSLRIRLKDVDDHVRGAVIVRIWRPPQSRATSREQLDRPARAVRCNARLDGGPL
jgi:hypothetical protein